MKSEILFEKGEHRCVVLGRDPDKKESVIDTNEYIIINEGQAVLLDPGGIEIFPQVLAEMTRHISPNQIKAIFASHQDPDIASSLSLWTDLCPNVKVYCPWIWTSFLAHFGMGNKLEFTTIPDYGMEIPVGDTKHSIFFVPAHYCHSSGNFSVFDPVSDILFTGDIGAALLPVDYPLFVNNFEEHIKYMDKFHMRWMPSKSALQTFVRRARAINPSIIAPQHGAIFKGENVNKFLNWLDNLEVGRWDSGEEAVDISKTVWMKWKK